MTLFPSRLPAFITLFAALALPMQAQSSAAAATAVAPSDNATGVAAQEIRFAPRDGARYIRTVKSQSATTVDGKVSSLGNTEVRIAERWEKEGAQWLLHCQTLNVDVREGGTAANEANDTAAKLQELLLQESYIIVFDANGSVADVRGFDAIGQQAQRELPQAAQAGAAAVLNTRSQRWRVASSWDTQYAWLYNKSWHAGETHTASDRLQPPLGPAFIRTQEATVTAIDASRLILSFQSANTAAAPAGKAPLITITEQGTVIIDSITGLPRNLRKVRVTQLQIPLEDGTIILQKRDDSSITVWEEVTGG